MERYSPGANVKSDYYHVCDYCEEDDGRPVLTWEPLPGRMGHFALCLNCIRKLYIEHVSFLDKKGESITIKRRIISEHLRTNIFARDNNRCINCGSPEYLQIDHVIPFSMGGETVRSNLQTLCKTCNLSKGMVKWQS